MNVILSPRINKLINDLDNNMTDALDIFWNDMKAHGTPLVEKISGDKNDVVVTFIYKGNANTQNVMVYGGVPGFRYSENILERLLDTDIWFKCYILRSDVKFKYNFSINYEFDNDYKKIKRNSVIDPLNINKITFIKNDENPEDEDTINSLVKLPDAKPDVWTIPSRDVKKGNIILNRLRSDILGDTRRVWIYTPHRYNDKNAPYDLLVLTDGFDYLNYLSAQTVFDNLIAGEKVAPMVCILIDNTEKRYKELTCNESFSRFITEEILPWASSKYNITRRPEETTIGGVSLGGLMASYIALKNSHIFGNVLSQSGSYWYDSRWLTQQFRETERLPIKFYLNAGVLEDRPYDDEPIMMEVINDMRDVLLSKGYTVKYENFPSGHDYLSWGDTLATGLMNLK